MRLLWTPVALNNRRQIREYIERDNSEAALALDELISEKAARLVDFPALGRRGRVAGTRELVVHRNYLLIYQVAGDTVRVLRVLHAAQQWLPREG